MVYISNRRPRSRGRQTDVNRDPEPWEIQVLALISEQVAIPMDLLASLLGISRERTEGLMEKFVGRRWVGVKRFLVADEPWVWLRSAGVKRAGTGYGWVKPGLWALPHHRAVCAVRAELEEKYPDGVWVCERALARRQGLVHHVPDAVFEVPNEKGKTERWAIEAELSQKQPARYREIAADRTERYDRLLYFCSSPLARRLKKLSRVADNPAVDVFDFFEDPRRIKNFQWAWSVASGPGEAPANRQPESWELSIIRLISEQVAVPIDQLARFLECSEEAAQNIADHLDRAGFLCQGRGPVDDSPWLWVTKTGGRLAGTGLEYQVPRPTAVESKRLINEVRLHVAERDWDVRWWSMRLLLRGSETRSVPIAVVEADGKQHAIEIEITFRTRRQLIEKYDRRCHEFQAVVVFCTKRRAPTFEKLKRERGWRTLYVQPVQTFNMNRPHRTVPRRSGWYVEISPKELPRTVLEVVQEAEHLVSPPPVKSAARAIGSGFPRWRVKTESGQWCVTDARDGWSVRPCDELNEPIEPPTPPGAPESTSALEEAPQASPQSMAKVSANVLPQEAVEAVKTAAGLEAPPTVKGAKRRGTAKPATDAEDEASDTSPLRRWPKDPRGVMIDIEPEDVPREALETIQGVAGMSWLPVVVSASKRGGRGIPRWRIETDNDIWRVTHSRAGWAASLSE